MIPLLRCRRCHVRGHTAAECGDSWTHWERPIVMEELIPADLRVRYSIATRTDMSFDLPRGTEGTDKERKIEVEVSRQDKPMRAFMKDHAIPTTHDMESNIQRIRDWSMRSGFRLRIV